MNERSRAIPFVWVAEVVPKRYIDDKRVDRLDGLVGACQPNIPDNRRGSDITRNHPFRLLQAPQLDALNNLQRSVADGFEFPGKAIVPWGAAAFLQTDATRGECQKRFQFLDCFAPHTVSAKSRRLNGWKNDLTLPEQVYDTPA